MYIPHGKFKVALYRLRGTKIGQNVDISSMVFLDEAYPEFITIQDNVDIGPGTYIVVHDSSLRCIQKDLPLSVSKVCIEENVYIGTSVVILPGVTIGKNSIIAAGSVVTRDIPPNSVAAGDPARIISTLDEYKAKHNLRP
jgi:maltose O-acetyltransferase